MLTRRTCRRLAERLAPRFRRAPAEYPWLTCLESRALTGDERAARTAAPALREAYNEAQLDVLQRMHVHALRGAARRT